MALHYLIPYHNVTRLHFGGCSDIIHQIIDYSVSKSLFSTRILIIQVNNLFSRRRLPWANPYLFYIDPDKNPLYGPLHCITKFAADILSVISNVGMYLEYDFGKLLEPGE